MYCQPLPSPLSSPSAKLMIMALEEYGYQSRRGIRVPKKWRSSYSGDIMSVGKPWGIRISSRLACEIGDQAKVQGGARWQPDILPAKISGRDGGKKPAQNNSTWWRPNVSVHGSDVVGDGRDRGQARFIKPAATMTALVNKVQVVKCTNYRGGDPSIKAMSDVFSFKTMLISGPKIYPKIGIMGDLGLTHNTTSTVSHLIKNQPDPVLLVRDATYANLYLTNGTGSDCYSCSFDNTPIHETYQPRWDYWGRYMQRLTSKIPIMAIKGNHEIKEQVESTTFAAYSTRFAFPSEESGSKSAIFCYYVYLWGCDTFVSLLHTLDQYKWLQRDLEKVDRGVTLWLVGVWHPPWYNTYVSHYKEVKCMRVAMEELLYNAGVDLIFNGHVSVDYDEPLRIELLQLATLLLKYLQTDLDHRRKKLIKFGWNHLKREDSASKQWAFINVCHFLKAYQALEKIILQVDVAPIYTMFVRLSLLSQLSLHPEYFTSHDNRRLAIELAGLVVNWERQRQNEMKIVNNGDGSSQNNDALSITSNGADPKWSVDGPTLKQMDITQVDPLANRYNSE
ncbi:purple acid phosphatase 15 [Tanacetum coccineum]